MAKKKTKKKPLRAEVLPFSQFFSAKVYRKELRSNQHTEIQLFFTSLGLGPKETQKTFEKALQRY